MPTTRAAAPLCLAAFVAAALPGCAVDNDRLTIGDGKGNDVVLTSIERGAALAPADGPSVTGADRSHWPETPAPVPMDRVHDHGFTVDTRRWSNPRHAGRFPTPEQSVTVRGMERAWSGAGFWQRVPGGPGGGSGGGPDATPSAEPGE